MWILFSNLWLNLKSELTEIITLAPEYSYCAPGKKKQPTQNWTVGMPSTARDTLGLNVSIRTIKALDADCQKTVISTRWQLQPTGCQTDSFPPNALCATWVCGKSGWAKEAQAEWPALVSKLSTAQVTPSSCRSSEPGFMRAAVEISL